MADLTILNVDVVCENNDELFSDLSMFVTAAINDFRHQRDNGAGIHSVVLRRITVGTGPVSMTDMRGNDA